MKLLRNWFSEMNQGTAAASACVVVFTIFQSCPAQAQQPSVDSITASAGSGAQTTLKLCYERADIAPWRRTDDTGLNFELIRLAARKIGQELQFVNLPWKRCLAQMQTNEVHGVFAASFQAERLAFGAYPGGTVPDETKRLHVDRYVLVRRKGDAVNWDGRSITQLRGSVGAQLGYSVVKQLREMDVPVDDGSQTAIELLKKLLAGRLGAAALGGSDAASLLAANSALARQLEVLHLPLSEKPYFLMLSNQLAEAEPERAQRFWQAIAVARQSVEYRKLEREALKPVAK